MLRDISVSAVGNNVRRQLNFWVFLPVRQITVSAGRLNAEHFFCHSGRQQCQETAEQLGIYARQVHNSVRRQVNYWTFCQSGASKQEIKSVKISEPQAKFGQNLFRDLYFYLKTVENFKANKII